MTRQHRVGELGLKIAVAIHEVYGDLEGFTNEEWNMAMAAYAMSVIMTAKDTLDDEAFAEAKELALLVSDEGGFG